MYINHLTLSAGHNKRIQSGDVAGETLARIGPWLAVVVDANDFVPLPVGGLTDFTGHAAVYDGGLLMTISGVAPTSGRMQGSPPPLVTMGIAKRSRHAKTLWPLMTGPVMPPAKAGIVMPAEPWCAVAIWPTIVRHPESMAWLADLEACIAWAWVTRSSDAEERT